MRLKNGLLGVKFRKYSKDYRTDAEAARRVGTRHQHKTTKDARPLQK